MYSLAMVVERERLARSRAAKRRAASINANNNTTIHVSQSVTYPSFATSSRLERQIHQVWPLNSHSHLPKDHQRILVSMPVVLRLIKEFSVHAESLLRLASSSQHDDFWDAIANAVNTDRPAFGAYISKGHIVAIIKSILSHVWRPDYGLVVDSSHPTEYVSFLQGTSTLQLSRVVNGLGILDRTCELFCYGIIDQTIFSRTTQPTVRLLIADEQSWPNTISPDEWSFFTAIVCWPFTPLIPDMLYRNVGHFAAHLAPSTLLNRGAYACVFASMPPMSTSPRSGLLSETEARTLFWFDEPTTSAMWHGSQYETMNLRHCIEHLDSDGPTSAHFDEIVASVDANVDQWTISGSASTDGLHQTNKQSPSVKSVLSSEFSKSVQFLNSVNNVVHFGRMRFSRPTFLGMVNDDGSFDASSKSTIQTPWTCPYRERVRQRFHTAHGRMALRMPHRFSPSGLVKMPKPQKDYDRFQPPPFSEYMTSWI